MKRIGAFALAAALTGSLSLTALAAEPEPETAPGPGAAYVTEIVLNGEKLDTTGIPGVSGALLPMRLVAEADYGSAGYYEEEGTGAFYLEGNSITVTFSTGAVEVNGTLAEGVGARVVDGVTFLPASVIGSLEGYTLNQNPALDVSRIEITTPNNDPLVKLAYEVMEAADMGRGTKTAPEDMEEYYQIRQENFTQCVGFFPMITSPDTIIIGKVADGKLEAAKADLEAYRKRQEDTFTWYLGQNLPKVQSAQVVVSGDYLLFLIAEDAQAGAAAFQAGVKGL